MSIRIVFYGLLFLSTIVIGQDTYIDISFTDLDEWMLNHNLQAKRIQANYNLYEVERNIDLQWSNPEFNYFNESIKNDNIDISEQLYFLSKTFEMPWIHWNNSEAWEYEVQSEAYKKQQFLNELLEKTKCDYVELVLLEEQQAHLQILESVVEDLININRIQYQEGESSALVEYLINVSLFNMQSDLFNSVKKYRQRLTKWKNQMGLADSITVRLSTKITFRDLSLPINETVLQLEVEHPGLVGMQKRVLALDKRIGVEKSRIWPNFTVSAGLKKTTPDFNGYVLGVSTPIPLLNWNGNKVEKLQIEKKLQYQTADFYRKRLNGQIVELKNNISLLTVILQKTQNPLNKERDVTKEMLAAYREGHWTLNEFLNAIQIHKQGIISYTGQLAAYYRSIFRFETITGKKLVKY